MKLATTLIMSAALIPSLSSLALAKEIKTNTAQMQAMDKVTGRVKVVEVPVNGNVNFGTFSILVRDCQTRPPEETPENYAFVDILDNNTDGSKANIFRGWMLSSTPALNAVEHPIYDVWLLKCIDTNVDATSLLSKEQLDERNNIAKVQEETPRGKPVNLLANIEEEAKSLFEPNEETPVTDELQESTSITEATETLFEPIENNIPTVIGEDIEFKEAIEDVEQSSEQAVGILPAMMPEPQVIIPIDAAIPDTSTISPENISQPEGPVNLLNLPSQPQEQKLPTKEIIPTNSTTKDDKNKFVVKGLVPDNIEENTDVIFDNEAPNVRMSEESFPLEIAPQPKPSVEENTEKSLELIVDDLLKNNETNKVEPVNKELTPATQEDSVEFDLIY